MNFLLKLLLLLIVAMFATPSSSAPKPHFGFRTWGPRYYYGPGPLLYAPEPFYYGGYYDPTVIVESPAVFAPPTIIVGRK